MRYFPMFLDFQGQRVLAVGGGEAILNKIRLLQRTSAAIELVAETLDNTLDGLVSHGAVALVGRRFEPSHLDGVVAVFAAADDITNKVVFAAARARNVPVNVVDTPELSSFLTPAIVDRDPLIVAIGTEGTGPVLAQGVRARIEAMLPHRIGELSLAAGRLRDRVARAISPGPGRRAFWASYFFGPPADAFLADDAPAYVAAVDAAIEQASAPRTSQVSFLTAPSDPELLTLKAHRKLQEADCIVHDRGADPRILDYARRDAAPHRRGHRRPRPAAAPCRARAPCRAPAQRGRPPRRQFGARAFGAGSRRYRGRDRRRSRAAANTRTRMEGGMSQTSEPGKVVTANRLSDGAVVFLTRAAVWSEYIDNAVVAVEPQAAAALGEHGKRAEAANHVTGSYVIDVERRDGRVLPVHIRERIRALGPTVGDFAATI
jgi:siroheme synthase-like protein